MKKTAKAILVIFSVALSLLSVSTLVANYIYFGGKFSDTPNPITESDFLSVESTYIVNREGDKVQLKGVNLGGWLIQESWMCPVYGEDRQWANLDTITALEERGFTQEQIQKLFDTYQDNWITEQDIKSIAQGGNNVVRVPFWYRNFMTGVDGEWISGDFSENPGFKRLDWVIETSSKYGLYVVLDMHGCPGGQSLDHTCGTLNTNDLYTDETCQQTMKKLWLAIADRYKDNPAVAAYDIMNEPQNNSGYDGENYYDPWQSESWEKSNEIYDLMIKAIRSVDSQHIITVEGIWQVSNLPDPASMGWENVMYQVHLYDDTKQLRKNVNTLKQYMVKYKVAGYIGEFNNRDGLGAIDSSNLNYTLWTYKGVKSEHTGFFIHSGEAAEVNPMTDSYDEMLEKWGSAIRTENIV